MTALRLFLSSFLLLSCFPSLFAAEAGISYEAWKEACDKLPPNKGLRGRIPPAAVLPIKQFGQFGSVLDRFFEQVKTGAVADQSRWVGTPPSTNTFFNTETGYFLKGSRGAPPPIPFEPFAQKLRVPAGSEVFIHADLHGDVRSLMKDLAWLNENGYLKGFSIARTNFYMVFLGDYTDRGSYGTEVLYTLFSLKTANPDHMFLARGNHEEVSLQAGYGFFHEAQTKFGREFNAAKILRAYDFLPVVIYLGTGDDYIQCNHGGMEPGFSPARLLENSSSPSFQLLGSLKQQTYALSHQDFFAKADEASKDLALRSLQDFRPEDPIKPNVLGFMWNDFAVFGDDPFFGYDPGRAYVYGKLATQYILEHAGTANARLRAVFRGHQQSSAPNPMMLRLVASKGVFQLWQDKDGLKKKNASLAELSNLLDTSPTRTIPPGSVWTFNVAPDSVYGEGNGYQFDTFGILKTAEKFSDWQLRVVNVTVGP